MDGKTFAILAIIGILAGISYHYYNENEIYKLEIENVKAQVIVLNNALDNKTKEISVLKASQSVTNSVLDDFYQDLKKDEEMKREQINDLEILNETNKDWNSQIVPKEIMDFLNNADKAWRGR